VRLVQNFSTKYPTLDGHGNFGSVDNDPPAAMRYTETRLAPIAHKGFLEEIGLETVSFSNNFDGSQKEPDVLPAQLPFLLLNGSSGIAVGMATNIPPHNLGEIVDGLVALVKNKDIKSMTKITKEEVKKVAHLARLELNEHEISNHAEQLEKILEYIKQLEKIDTDDVPSTTRAIEVINVFRKDEKKNSDCTEDS